MNTGKYYDRHGRVISLLVWMTLYENIHYRRVKWTRVGYGQCKKRVSTVWLGLNHSLNPNDRPMIFETMVFSGNCSWYDVNAYRYTTEDEACRGHSAMVHKYSYTRQQRRRYHRRYMEYMERRSLR